VKAGITRLNGFWNFYQDLRHGITSVPMAGSPPGDVLLREVLWKIKNPILEAARSGVGYGLQLTCLCRIAYESSVPGNYMHFISNTTSLHFLSTFPPSSPHSTELSLLTKSHDCVKRNHLARSQYLLDRVLSEFRCFAVLCSGIYAQGVGTR
jgi:hypothetical protein